MRGRTKIYPVAQEATPVLEAAIVAYYNPRGAKHQEVASSPYAGYDLKYLAAGAAADGACAPHAVVASELAAIAEVVERVGAH